MIVDNHCPYTDDMAHQAAFMLDRLQSSSSDHPVIAATLADHLGLAQEQVWGIAEHLAVQHGICFTLEDLDCIFSPVKYYWMNGSTRELVDTQSLKIEAWETMIKEAEGLLRAANNLRACL